jgi:uncharacterized protein YndB with AHSA1/START domain
MRYATTVEIGAPPERVWAVLEDVEHWPDWTASIRTVEPLAAGGLAVGSGFRVGQPRMPALVWRVTALEPGRAFTWVARSPGIATTAVHEIEPADDGRSKVTLRVEQSGPLAGLLGWLTAGQTRRYVQMEADGLRRRAEAGAAA